MAEVLGKSALVARIALHWPRRAHGRRRYVSSLWSQLEPAVSPFIPAADINVCDILVACAGKLLRKPRDGHESWEDWHACWEEFCTTITTESAMMLAVYALRERALLLGLQPTKGASILSLPETKPTPRPRADAAETMLPLTEDLPELALVRRFTNCTVGAWHI